MSAAQAAPAPTFFTIPSREIGAWWPSVLPHIDRWLEREGTWTASGVRQELEAARSQLWCAYYGDIRGVWVTRIHDNGHRKVGVVWGCAGDFMGLKDEALQFFGVIEDWMRSMGCELIEISGREGWARIFHDYERHAVILRKRL